MPAPFVICAEEDRSTIRVLTPNRSGRANWKRRFSWLSHSIGWRRTPAANGETASSAA